MNGLLAWGLIHWKMDRINPSNRQSVDTRKECTPLLKALAWCVTFLALSLTVIDQAAVAASAATDIPAADESGPEFRYGGFAEFESFLNTDRNQPFSRASMKNEFRNRVDLTAGIGDNSFFATIDLYLQPTGWEESVAKKYKYTEEEGLKRNLRLTTEDGEIAFNELYLNFSRETYRLRIGNQIFRWGTADGINPSAYFNPYDQREFIFRDEDESRFGIPAVSAMVFLHDYTLEVVVSPVHISGQLAPNGNYWSLSNTDSLPSVRFDDPDGMPVTFGNIGYGARLSTNFHGTDASVSLYHGPSRDPVLVPTGAFLEPNQPPTVTVTQRYDLVAFIGADFSRTVGDIVFQAELAYSPNKQGLVEQSVPPYLITLPFSVERAHYLSYAVGFNYFIPLYALVEAHEGESVITVEWFQSTFFDDNIAQPYLFTDLLTCRYEDTFLDGSIPLSITALFDTRSGSTVFRPKIGWDFQNGWRVDLSYADIHGRSSDDALIDNAFYYFTDNDMITLNGRYSY